MARSAAGYAFVTELFLKITQSDIPLDVRTAEFLETHYGEPLSLEDVAAAVGADKYMLCHDFRKKRGISIVENLKQIRIAKAKRFLRYGSESIAEIGRMCGFESASYFIKRFREECGCTPREYRERH
jgi:AraC-like DNA-binding protein